MYLINNKTDILSLSKEELKNLITNKLNIENFRADQIYSWIYNSMGTVDFDQMSNISKAHQKIFEDNLYIGRLKILKKQISSDRTVKYLFGLHDGNTIESVFMKYNHGNTICISTQVGCRMGCEFCASAIGGFNRNLLPSEMLLQIMTAQNDMGERISNVVLMGIGEPLDNFDNVIKFLGLVNSKDGLNIGYRHISVSTCGLVDKINRLKEINIPVTLSVSLHAPNDKIRNLLMPVNRRYSIDKLIEGCKIYTYKTNRRVTFEYALIKGVNDAPDDARELMRKIRGMLCHINIIPVNKTENSEFQPSVKERIMQFEDILTKGGFQITVRRQLGSDIMAACGQLRNSMTK